LKIARVAFAVALLCAGLTASSATALEVTPEQALTHLAEARGLVADSVRLFSSGRWDDAHLAARNGYLDHFEFVEVALRKVDFGLMVDVEREFVRLRVSVQDGESLGDVDTIAVGLLDGFDRIERVLSAPPPEASVVAAGLGVAFVWAIGYGLIALVSRTRRGLRLAGIATVAAVVAAAVFGTLLVARSAIAVDVGAVIARLTLPVALGALVGAAALLVAGRMPKLRAGLASFSIAVVAVAVAGNVVRGLQLANVLPTTFIPAPKLSAYVSPMIGWHPTMETVMAEGLVAVAFASLIALNAVLARRVASPGSIREKQEIPAPA
jgi:hypothetical protein